MMAKSMSTNARTKCILAENSTTFEELMSPNVTVLNWESAAHCPTEIAGILVNGHTVIDGPLMDRYPNLKVISNCGVGVDHIDIQAAKERNIPVGNTPGILSEATADMAMALLLAAGRRLIEGDHYARSPEFVHFDGNYMLGTEIHHTTLGIIGMGRIGSEVARRAKGFNMKVIYHNRRPRNIDPDVGPVEYVGLPQLLQQSDYVVVVVPLNDTTRDLISTSELALMKPTAVLVNIARGGVVNTDAITKALQTKQIYAAALDVTEPEPLPRDHPLLKQNNLVIAPHLGSATVQTRQAMMELAISNLINGIAGNEIVSSVS